MKSVELKAFPRTAKRRTNLRRLRASGRVPATIYGRQKEAETLEVEAKELLNLIHHSVNENLLVELTVADNSRPRLVLVQEVQHHPLTGKVLHLDLHEVAEDEKVIVTVPVETTGTAVGVTQDAGVLEHVLFKIKVRALPRDLPEFIEVDVTNLKIGESIHLGDLKSAPGVEFLGDKNIPVVSVAVPRVETVEPTPAEAAAAVAAGPEVIKEKKPAESAPEGKGEGKGEKPEKGEKGQKGGG